MKSRDDNLFLQTIKENFLLLLLKIKVSCTYETFVFMVACSQLIIIVYTFSPVKMVQKEYL
jgi:hypothetical protein